MQTCASENICISTGYFCREDKCVKICLLEKNSGFDCLPNIIQVISDVVKCSAALLRLLFFFWHNNMLLLQCIGTYDILKYS